MWISFVFAVAFLVGALLNTFGAEPDPTEAIAGYAIALYLFDTWHLLRRHQRYLDEFAAWLIENRDAIKAGRAAYGDLPVTDQTEVKQYRAVTSFVVTISASSRFYLVGHETAFLTAVRFTLCSLTIGWWGLLGPFRTIGAVLTNLQGGKRRRIGDLLDELTGHEKAVVRLTERAAENVRRIMTEKGFPAGTALQVEVTGDPGFREYHITYDDRPPTDGSVWKSEDNGVLVIVGKEDAPKIVGLTIDFEGGNYVYKEDFALITDGEGRTV